MIFSLQGFVLAPLKESQKIAKWSFYSKKLDINEINTIINNVNDLLTEYNRLNMKLNVDAKLQVERDNKMRIIKKEVENKLRKLRSLFKDYQEYTGELIEAVK